MTSDPRRCALCGAPLPAELTPVWRRDGFAVARCPTCALLYRTPLPTLDELLESYSGEYFGLGREAASNGYRDYLEDADAHRRNARRCIGLLARHGASVSPLDVRSAVGFFVSKAPAAGCRACGIELSPAVARIGREEPYVDVRAGSFGGTDLPTESFVSRRPPE